MLHAPDFDVAALFAFEGVPVARVAFPLDAE